MQRVRYSDQCIMVLKEGIKLCIMLLIVWCAILTVINYKGLFPDFFIIVVLTVIISLLSLEFYPKIFKNCFFMPFILHLLLTLVSVWLAIKMSAIDLVIQGIITASILLSINTIVSLLIGKIYLRWKEKLCQKK